MDGDLLLIDGMVFIQLCFIEHCSLERLCLAPVLLSNQAVSFDLRSTLHNLCLRTGPLVADQDNLRHFSSGTRCLLVHVPESHFDCFRATDSARYLRFIDEIEQRLRIPRPFRGNQQVFLKGRIVAVDDKLYLETRRDILSAQYFPYSA